MWYGVREGGNPELTFRPINKWRIEWRKYYYIHVTRETRQPHRHTTRRAMDSESGGSDIRSVRMVLYQGRHQSLPGTTLEPRMIIY